ncbi:MAG: hypothetical protein JNM52_04610 [Betaproteobacteria bacterium]|nr:hypothetical protein [Betaproteobacteria bacterium]
MALFRGLLIFFVIWVLMALLLMVLTRLTRRQAHAIGKLLLFSGLAALCAGGLLYFIVITF